MCLLFVFRLATDLSEIESFALFPGQIVVIEGNNATGQVLVAKKIYTNARLPAATTNEANMENFQVGNSHICTCLSCYILVSVIFIEMILCMRSVLTSIDFYWCFVECVDR
jgi:hypothetical protein